MEELRKVKSAPPPGADRNEYIMSDDTVDRMGEVIEPSGWDLKDFKNHPIALFNHDRDQVIGKWADVRVQGNRLLGRLELAIEGTSPLVDNVRRLVAQNILRAVSVGFRPLEQKPIDDKASEFWGPFRYVKSELLECSLVAVPANPNALHTAKSLGVSGEFFKTLFRKPADETVHAKPGQFLVPTGKTMKPLSERIQDAQKIIVTYRDQINAILNENEQPDEAQQASIDELSSRIEAQEKSLNALLKAETAVTARAIVPVSQDRPKSPAIVHHPMKTIEPREHIVRAMAVHFIAKMSGKPLDEVLRERYPGDEGTGVVLKAAVAPAMTTVAGWAAELVNTVIVDFLNQLALVSIYPRLAFKGPRYTFGANGVIKIPGRSATPKINGSFVGEGQPIPVRKLGLAAITLTPKKMAVISEFTREMGLHSTPSIESVIRQSINEDTAEAIDQVLIDNIAADTTRPAGLRNGVSGGTPSAATTRFDKIVADIQGLMAPIVAARGGRDLVLLMNPAQYLAMQWAVAPNGTFVFADQGAPAMRSITPISSTTVPAGMLIMIDAADFASVTGDTPEFDVSDVATIHEEDSTLVAPIVGGTTMPPTVTQIAAPVRSLWQTASIGIRMMLDMNWSMRRTGMVSWVTGVTW